MAFISRSLLALVRSSSTTPSHLTRSHTHTRLLPLSVSLLLVPLVLAPPSIPSPFVSVSAASRSISVSSRSETQRTSYTPNTDMAWRCSGSTQGELLGNMRAAGLIESARVAHALSRVDRALFVPRMRLPGASEEEAEEMQREMAYQDTPVPIGYGATISAPHMHAMCLELLEDRLKEGCTALDVGSGSGFLAAAMAEMIQPSKKKEEEKMQTAGQTAAAAVSQPSSTSGAATSGSSSESGVCVWGIEHIEELVRQSKDNLARWDPNYESRIRIMKGDGRLGLAGHQFDAIHVGAAAATLPPALIEQLKPGGRLIIPVGSESQNLEQIDKDANGKITRKIVTGVRYVPLTSEENQLRGAY